MYTKPELEIIEFTTEDVITTSGAGAGYSPNNPHTLPWDEDYD